VRVVRLEHGLVNVTTVRKQIGAFRSLGTAFQDREGRRVKWNLSTCRLGFAIGVKEKSLIERKVVSPAEKFRQTSVEAESGVRRDSQFEQKHSGTIQEFFEVFKLVC
jgi:hypothetical protein